MPLYHWAYNTSYSTLEWFQQTPLYSLPKAYAYPYVAPVADPVLKKVRRALQQCLDSCAQACTRVWLTSQHWLGMIGICSAWVRHDWQVQFIPLSAAPHLAP